MEELKTSAQWAEEKGVVVLDPDGWDRKNYHYSWNEEEITEAEFERRKSESTTLVQRPE